MHGRKAREMPLSRFFYAYMIGAKGANMEAHSNNFWAWRAYSMGNRQQFDISMLVEIIPNYAGAVKTGLDVDKQGVDYIVSLTDGSSVTIDAKTRKAGSSKWWQNGVELCLERYSVVEQKKVGWLFKDSTVHPDYILYTFDRSDTDKYFLIPYLLLRKAAYRHWKEWEARYGIKKQPNSSHGGYTSDAVFVPATVVMKAVTDEMMGTI